MLLGGTSSDKGVSYSAPTKYEIGGITVSGTKNLDKTAISLLSGLSVGDVVEVPGEKIGGAIKSLWDQNLFDDVQIYKIKTQGNKIFINIHITELPRLSRFKFTGISKSEADDLREEIGLYKERIVNDNLVQTTKNTIQNYFVDKGFLNVDVDIENRNDSIFYNHVMLIIDIEKHKKVRIKKIDIDGNVAFSDWQVRMNMKETKRKSNFKPFIAFDTLLFTSLKRIARRDFVPLRDGVFTYVSDNVRLNVMKSSKYIEGNFEGDKAALIAKYNQKGYRDAKIEQDTVYKDGKHISIDLNINEGNQYYFRNITWIGNTKYSTKMLNKILGIERGDIYNQEQLDMNLFMNPNGGDVSSLYMDDGYLFFQIMPVEVLVEADSIDIELRIYEGQQARINKVTVLGNSKTNDHVVMREIRTKPGQLFSRSDIIRTQRELAQLGYFNAETLNVNPKPNPVDGTVDIEYLVEEKSNDQIELSGGWGGGRIVGTLGVSFNNFSTKGLLRPKTWDPLPSGDGQRLSIRAQSNGAFYQSYNISFTEPWLGGRRPNALSISAYHSVQTLGQSKYIKQDGIFLRNKETKAKIMDPLRQSVAISGVSVGLGRRLSWPDDYFMLYQELNYQHYRMNNWSQFIFSDGIANNLFYKINISRSSVDQPIYPRLGSEISLSLQVTPPYSMFKEDGYYKNQDLEDRDKYKWVEYHKWKFTSSWYTKIVGDLVLKTKVGFGYLGSYNKDIGIAPLERFYLGGSGLTGFSLDGREIIALRGYDDNAVSPRTGANLINKYTMEVRYPFSLNPSATIYGLGFVEAGNTWDSFTTYNPFAVKRSTGVGIRIFLPMFGLLGLDYGWRFDDVQNMQTLGSAGAKRGQLHFTIGANLGEL
jgi:outer membrane protein insertion porin family